MHITLDSNRSWDEWTNADQMRSEAHTLIRFIDEADHAGLPIPADIGTISIELTRVLSPSYMPDPANGQLQWPPRTAWPVVALAQHYGLATRFLDWTRSAYIAAYFAAVDMVANSRAGEMAVRAFYATMWQVAVGRSYIGDRYPVVVTAPYASNPNLQAQRGVHMSVPVKTLALSAPAQRDDFAEQLCQIDSIARRSGFIALRKFVLPAESAPHLGNNMLDSAAI